MGLAMGCPYLFKAVGTLRRSVEGEKRVRLRAQLLRRIQMVTGQGAVRDLLVAEFVID
jgi:hypothetical protein